MQLFEKSFSKSFCCGIPFSVVSLLVFVKASVPMMRRRDGRGSKAQNELHTRP